MALFDMVFFGRSPRCKDRKLSLVAGCWLSPIFWESPSSILRIHRMNINWVPIPDFKQKTMEFYGSFKAIYIYQFHPISKPIHTICQAVNSHFHPFPTWIIYCMSFSAWLFLMINWGLPREWNSNPNSWEWPKLTWLISRFSGIKQLPSLL